MSPKISIIVPIYKTEDTLERCVNSIICQTLKDIEIILVDDGSPDSTPQMCDKFAENYDNIKVIHKKNGGLSSARNEGIRIATGDFIGFVDSDDYVKQDMFEKMYNRAIIDNSDICICSHYTVDKYGNVFKNNFDNLPEIIENNAIAEKLILPLIGHTDNDKNTFDGFVVRNLYRSDLIKEEKFLSEREFFAEDVVFQLSVYKKCKKISILNECLYYYVFNGDSLTNTYRKGVHILLNNLLSFEINYLNDNNLEDNEDRIHATALKLLYFSLKNASKEKSGSFFAKKKIIKEILNQPILFKYSTDINKGSINTKTKIFVFLCKHKMINLLSFIF